MAECITCGEYTKFNGGLCFTCYKKDGKSKDVPVAEKETEKTIVKKSESKSKENPWISGVIKGRIAETIVEELFRSLGFQVFSYGMENSIPGIKDLLKGVRGDVSKNIRQMPDFVVFKDNQAHFIEVKYRASGELSLKDIAKYGDYPFENALFVLVTKKHIKCISYNELSEGKEITSSSRNYLGNRKEFDTDKDLIIEYCEYAVKFFENV
ncbi:hypothetical protein [Cellulophaga baltica]|uniref:Endonuclease n=1 Tax=Cellulophaga baltica 18 TaxID=1348584 RepID=A0AAU8RR67_9FLAO|nr:hypothetical protein [Cellulophaga baltica]AIZ40349.1 hypothetical protein M666_01390 [Cellulophaga baltica 18]